VGASTQGVAAGVALVGSLIAAGSSPGAEMFALFAVVVLVVDTAVVAWARGRSVTPNVRL